MSLHRCVDLRAGQLSFGQQRRLALSRLLLLSNRLWILDEPFTGLDVKAVECLQDICSQHVTQGGLLVFTSHQAVALASIKVKKLALA